MSNMRRVLVVDDSIVVCRLVEKIVRSCGFEHVEIAQSGELALECLGKSNFDLVICDWEMQPMNGIEVLNGLRGDRQFRKPRFILMSARKEPEWILAAKKAGVDAVIPKPFTADMLMQKINQLGARP